MSGSVQIQRRLFGVYLSPWGPSTRGRLAAQLALDRPDVVLADFGPTTIDTAPACAELGIPLVAHFNGYDLSSLLHFRGYRRSLISVLKTVVAAVVVNDDHARAVIELGYPEHRVHLIPYGVDTSRLRPAGSNRDDTGFAFLAVGRPVPKKAPLATIRAFKECHDRVPGARLTMVGAGPLAPEATKPGG